jgi:N-ethylmaleimide reductase
MTDDDPIFTPLDLGEIRCVSRIVMAPMTRSRAAPGDLVSELHVEYYGARSDAGLIVTEGTQPSIHGKGYCRTPGLHDAEQVAAWRAVTDRVHDAGSRMVVQLMHVGRVASRYNKHSAARTIAPSAIAARVQMYTDDAGMQDCDVPEALSLAEIPSVVGEYARAARLAREAGFDGVELHAASGYLPMQFLCSNSNQRRDAYGGAATNRARFVVEVLEALCATIGAGRVGMRICPANPFNDVADPEPALTYRALLEGIGPLGIAYLHVIRSPIRTVDAFALARRHFAGPIVLNDGFHGDSARAAIRGGAGAAVSFARHFIGNPDLVRRLRERLPLAGFDRHTLYTNGPVGYVDYPRFKQVQSQDADDQSASEPTDAAEPREPGSVSGP